MIKYIIFTCLFVISNITSAQTGQTSLFNVNSNGDISPRYNYCDNIRKKPTTYKLKSKFVYPIECSASPYILTTYKNVHTNEVVKKDYHYVYSQMPGDGYHLEMFEWKGLKKAILCHDHADDLVLVWNKTSVYTENLGYRTFRELLEAISHNCVPFCSPGAVYPNYCELATYDVIETVRTDDKFTIKGYKCTGEGWDNEPEDFNVIEVYNDATGECIASTYGVFSNFSANSSLQEYDCPFYQIDMKSCTAILITGKENSGVPSYFTIIVIKNGKAQVVMRKQASLWSIEETDDSVVLELEGMRTGWKGGTLKFEKNTDNVYFTQEYK